MKVQSALGYLKIVAKCRKQIFYPALKRPVSGNREASVLTPHDKQLSNLSLFSHFQGVINFYAQIPDCTF